MTYKLITPPTGDVVELDAVKRDLRADGDEYDADIQAQVNAAIEEIESDCRRQLLEAEWTLYLDRFPVACEGRTRDILIEKCPGISVDEIRYFDTAGNQQTLDAEDYQVDIVGEPVRVSPAYGLYWPATRAMQNAVEVDFTAGYGDPDDVPDIAKQVIRLRVRELYEGCSQADAIESLKLRLKWGDQWLQ